NGEVVVGLDIDYADCRKVGVVDDEVVRICEEYGTERGAEVHIIQIESQSGHVGTEAADVGDQSGVRWIDHGDGSEVGIEETSVRVQGHGVRTIDDTVDLQVVVDRTQSDIGSVDGCCSGDCQNAVSGDAVVACRSIGSTEGEGADVCNVDVAVR